VCRIASGNDREGVFFVEGIGCRTPQSRISVRVKAVIPRESEGPGISGIVELDTPVDRIFLIPKQTALNVHILERERVFGTDQCRKFADLDRKNIIRRDLEKRLRDRTVKIAGKLTGVEIWAAERRESICACLNEKLNEAICLLDKDLTIAQARYRVMIDGESVGLR
jgi:hypothetical protein